MADKSAIEWTDATWNPLAGCSIVSSGCTNCYAMKLAARLLDKPGSHYEGTTKAVNGHTVWTGAVRLAPEHILSQPLRWVLPRRIFVNSMSDLFHESVPTAWIDRILAVAALCPAHTFQILTKRPERMGAYFNDTGTAERIFKQSFNISGGRSGIIRHDEFVVMNKDAWPLKNVWLGVSVEDQRSANERIPHLLNTPAAIRFLSCEPLLGPVCLEEAWHGESALDAECWGDCSWCKNGKTPLHNCQNWRQSTHEYDRGRSGVDWVIVGGESGPNARPMHPDWVTDIRDECVAANVPFFFKQWGEWAPGYCAPKSPTKTERIATFWGDEWSYDKLTPRASFEMHRDDEPDVYRLGKRASGRIIEGRTWDEFPEVSR